jgi:putative DNA primase/helicase
LGPEAIGPRGTLAQTYLRSRALELPDEAANAAIRFHPACRFGNERMPAMVCLVRNIRTDEPQAIHRTALSPDGTAVKRNSKTFRMTLDPIADGAVKLDLDEDVTQGVCIAEGVETALAGRQMGLRPVWALLGESGLASFPVLPGVDGLHIFREHDATNKRAAMACAGRWHEAGRDVFHVCPEIGSDLNDELLEATK